MPLSHHDYLIIGGGMTAAAAIKGIRQVDAGGSIGVIGAEPDPPYKRPPLTKKLWQGKSIDSVWLGADRPGVDLMLGCTVVSLDPDARKATDHDGGTHTYDKLLLATGVRPRRLPFGQDAIIAFRTVEDYRRLRALTESAHRIAVIGGGFIGSELSASLASNKKEVTLVFPGNGIGSHLFPADLSLFLNDFYREKGVTVLPGESISGFDQHDGVFSLTAHTKSAGRDHVIDVDGVVAGIGTEPNTELAQSAGIAVDDGIIVDEFLRTNRDNIFAAGDVASFPDHALGKRRRVEHEDNANSMGKLAGRNMAGEHEAYTHLPFFYSDLFELGYEAVGEVDSRLQTFEDWKTPFKEGVVYYLNNQKVRGVLLWNVWKQIDAATALIAEGATHTPADLKGRLGSNS